MRRGRTRRRRMKRSRGSRRRIGGDEEEASGLQVYANVAATFLAHVESPESPLVRGRVAPPPQVRDPTPAPEGYVIAGAMYSMRRVLADVRFTPPADTYDRNVTTGSIFATLMRTSTPERPQVWACLGGRSPEDVDCGGHPWPAMSGRTSTSTRMSARPPCLRCVSSVPLQSCRTIARHTPRKVTSSDHGQLRSCSKVAKTLSNICATVAPGGDFWLRRTISQQTLANFGSIWPRFDQSRPTVVNVGQHFPNSGRNGPNLIK